MSCFPVLFVCGTVWTIDLLTIVILLKSLFRTSHVIEKWRRPPATSGSEIWWREQCSHPQPLPDLRLLDVDGEIGLHHLCRSVHAASTQAGQEDVRLRHVRIVVSLRLRALRPKHTHTLESMTGASQFHVFTIYIIFFRLICLDFVLDVIFIILTWLMLTSSKQCIDLF